jgi:hypothetical protein
VEPELGLAVLPRVVDAIAAEHQEVDAQIDVREVEEQVFSPTPRTNERRARQAVKRKLAGSLRARDLSAQERLQLLDGDDE